MTLTRSQSHAARALLGWSQENLAGAAGLSPRAIQEFEAGESLTSDEEAALCRAFDEAGIELIERGSISYRGGSGVRLRNGEVDEGLRPEDLTSQNDG